MSISIKNIKDIESKSFTISGLPKEIGIVDGSTVTVVWANDIHVELISSTKIRVCLRTHLVYDLLSYIETK